MKKLLASTCLTLGLMGGVSAASAVCGTFSIVLGDTVPTLTSVAEKGQPDIAPEAWGSLRPPITEKNTEEGLLIVAGNAFEDGGVQGVYVPKFLVDENPEIKTIADAVARPDLFPNREDPSKGAWTIGAKGWGGTVVLSQHYKAYKAEEAGFALVDSGSAAGHDGSLINAYERGRG